MPEQREADAGRVGPGQRQGEPAVERRIQRPPPDGLRQHQLDEFPRVVDVRRSEHERDQRHQREDHVGQAQHRARAVAAKPEEQVRQAEQEQRVGDEPATADDVPELGLKQATDAHAALMRMSRDTARSSRCSPVSRCKSSMVPWKRTTPSSRKRISSASSSTSLMRWDVSSTVAPASAARAGVRRFLHLFLEHAVRQRVEPRGGLVKNEERGPEPEGDRRVELLARASRKESHRLVEGCPELETVNQVVVGGVAGPQGLDQGEYFAAGEVFRKRRALRHVPDPAAVGRIRARDGTEHRDGARIRTHQAEDALDEGRLAGGVGPDDGGHAPGSESGIHPIQYRQAAKSLSHSAQLHRDVVHRGRAIRGVASTSVSGVSRGSTRSAWSSRSTKALRSSTMAGSYRVTRREKRRTGR